MEWRNESTVEPTISNDRTRGSPYDTNHERLAALPKLGQPATGFRPLPALAEDFEVPQHAEQLEFFETVADDFEVPQHAEQPKAGEAIADDFEVPQHAEQSAAEKYRNLLDQSITFLEMSRSKGKNLLTTRRPPPIRYVDTPPPANPLPQNPQWWKSANRLFHPNDSGIYPSRPSSPSPIDSDQHREVNNGLRPGGPARNSLPLANYLGIPERSASSLDAIRAYISELQRHQSYPEPPIEPHPLTIHRVLDDRTGIDRIYLDRPQWQEGGHESHQILMGALPISNVELYISKHPEVCFIVCREYNISPTPETSKEDQDGNAIARHHTERIVPVETHLASAIRRFAIFIDNELNHPMPTHDDSDNSDDSFDLESLGSSDHSDHSSGSDGEYQEFTNDWLDGDNGATLSSPYLHFYHARDHLIHTFTRSLNVYEQSLFQRVVGYITAAFEDEYAYVDSLIAESQITNQYLPYLVKPGVVLVQGQGKNARGYMCSSWLETPHRAFRGLRKSEDHGARLTPRQAFQTEKEAEDREFRLGESEKPRKIRYHTVHAWHWDFDRKLAKTHTKLKMKGFTDNDHIERRISEMELRPLSHVDSETSRILQNRGEWFWKCRRARMVAYHENAKDEPHNLTSERYMIDIATYNELHSTSFPTEFPKAADRIGSGAMKMEDPPDATFVYLAPMSMRGFNLKTKKWRNLSIDRFTEVEWNSDAFKSLVLNGNTKRLIQALISNQIEAEMATDIISGKGNGLIMLLHGGPGTGKTLTAESVAEIAKRPLYPVTCGDIGTEPRAVETYLESVLHLGRTWGCVVLLDEADVFLEQRSLEDLHRNALVSVFLRVLEYYDGILVLTSNRVGTFDEAFKSRIQLAIHYTSLSTHQRTRIWGNFLGRLKRMNEDGIDFVDLEDHVEDLARHKMNGREIRNVITTARQFARWERKQPGGASFRLNYRVMEEIVETSGKFDRYIEKLNGGMSQDQLAEDEGLRLAEAGSATPAAR